MDKRLKRSLTLTAFLLVIIFAAKNGERKYYDYKIEKCTENGQIRPGATAGSCDICPIITSRADTSANTVMVVAEPESESEEEIPEIERSFLYQFYINTGYGHDKFYKDLNLLAAITMAEAGNQSELGKRLVIDTVLNRCNSDRWMDDTIYDVISREGQYTTYITGAYNRVSITEDIPKLVEEEILDRTNRQVIYFKTNGYFAGVPDITKEGAHYFSGDW